MSLCINFQCKSLNPDNTLFCTNCGSELLVVGRYRVIKLLSDKGGFADTYEVLHRGIPKVMKVLKEQSQKAIELFEREYQVLKQSNHPGIPKAEDYFHFMPKNSPAPLYCLVMEKIFGKDLEDYIKEVGRPIDQKCAIEWLYQLTEILKEIHSNNLLHRDIKPSNIILKPDGQLVLIDFGAVKQVASIQARSKTCISTPGYAAPEQEKGNAVPQSDFFSLGRTFVYLLTEIEPINLVNARTNELLWRDRVSHISPVLVGFIDQLMEHSPNQRPTDAQDILQYLIDIQKMLDQPSIQTTKPLPPTLSVSVSQPSLKKIWRFFKFLLIGALAVLIASIAIHSLERESPSSIANNFTDIEAKEVPKGEFTFGGSTTWATTRQQEVAIDSAINGAFPDFKLKYVDPTKKDKDDNFEVKSVREGKCPSKTGSNTGICMLLNGDLSFSQSSTSLEKSEYASESKRLKEIAVAWDALTVVIHPELNISGLTVAQLRDIYSGEITNWNQINNSLDLPIVPLSRPLSAGGTVSSFKDMIFKDPVADKQYEFNWNAVKEVANPTLGLREVRNVLDNGYGAIFYGSAKEMIVDSCYTKPIPIGQDSNNFIPSYQEPLKLGEDCELERNQINTETIQSQKYPLTRKIFVILKQDDSLDERAGKAYAKLLLTQQGQKLLEKAGFVSLQ